MSGAKSEAAPKHPAIPDYAPSIRATARVTLPYWAGEPPMQSGQPSRGGFGIHTFNS